MINTAGVTVIANTTSLTSALQDYLTSGQSGFDSLILGILSSSSHHIYGFVLTPSNDDDNQPGSSPGSWPLGTFAALIYRQKTMKDCNKAAALANFMLWGQTDSTAAHIATRQVFGYHDVSLSLLACHVCVDCYVAMIDDIDVLECQAGVPADHCRLELQELMAELPGQLHLQRGDREFGSQLRAQRRAVFEPGRVRQQQLRLQRRATGSIL